MRSIKKKKKEARGKKNALYAGKPVTIVICSRKCEGISYLRTSGHPNRGNQLTEGTGRVKSLGTTCFHLLHGSFCLIVFTASLLILICVYYVITMA